MIINTNKNHFCPHCGTETNLNNNTWLDLVNDTDSILCETCNNPLKQSHKTTDITSGNYIFGIRFITIFTVLSGFLYLLNLEFNVLRLTEDTGRIIYSLMLILIISSVLAGERFFQRLKYLTIWIGIFALFALCYSYRYEITMIKDTVIAQLIPSKGIQKTVDSISFPISSDGHFYIQATVNSIPITFLADTGASQIVLSPDDAEKLGFMKSDLDFTQFFETANGIVRGSPVHITDFKIGNIYLKNIRVSVNEAEMNHSLLGMSFFNHLKSFHVTNETLTLYL